MKTRFSRTLETLTSLSIALLLGAGFWFVLFYASAFVEPLLPKTVGNHPAGQWEIPMFTREGELRLVNPSKDQFLLTYGGQTIQMPNSVRRIDPHANSPETTVVNLAPSVEWIEYPDGINHFESQLNVFSNGGPSFEYWYFVKHSHPKKHGYFVGYEKDSQLLIGFIGRNGFQVDRPSREECFPLTETDLGVAVGGSTQVNPGNLPKPWTESEPMEFALQTNRKVWMGTVEGIWQCDLGTRSVKPFAPVQDVDALYVAVDHKGWRQKVLARTKQSVHVFDDSGKEISRFEYPLVGNDFLTLSLTDSGNSVLVVTKYTGWSMETTRTVSITWFDSAGNKIRESSQPLKFLPFEEGRFRNTKPVISGSSVAMALAGSFPEMSRTIRRMVVNDQYWFPIESISYRIFGAVATVLAICWLWWHQARNRASKTQMAIWTVFVVLFGVTGLLGYWFHRRWPALVRCQVCGERTFANGPGCPLCVHAGPESTILGRDLVVAEITPMLAQSA